MAQIDNELRVVDLKRSIQTFNQNDKEWRRKVNVIKIDLLVTSYDRIYETFVVCTSIVMNENPINLMKRFSI